MLSLPRSVTVSLASLLIASCASFGDPLPSTVVDDSFQKFSLRFRNSLGTPQPVTYYMKVYSQDGMLAVCGVSVLTRNGVMDQLADLWINEAFVVIKNRSNKIVRARFIGQVAASREPKLANCVKTATPATPELLNARVRLAGGQVTFQ